MNTYTRRWSAVGLMAVAGVAGAQSASDTPGIDGSEKTPGDSQLQEVVVTAQRRSESVQKIPIAVTALSGDSLLERGTTNLEALSQTAPGLNVSEQVGQARLTLRGIGLDNISTGAESSVAFQIKTCVFYSRSAAALASFYDVDRVEILRGPQGTLYGRNATGGSVNILTNQPTDTLHGGINLTLGNFQTANTEGFISGPLADYCLWPFVLSDPASRRVWPGHRHRRPCRYQGFAGGSRTTAHQAQRPIENSPRRRLFS